MKKIIAVLVLLIATGVTVWFTGCSKVKSLANINFDVPYNQQIEVPNSGYAYGVPLPTGGITLPFPKIPVPTNSKQYIDQYKTSTDKILSVDLKSMGLEILSPVGQNFDFLDNIQVYISMGTQPEVLLASQASVAKGQNTLQFTPDASVNLKPYFLADTIYLRMQAHINAVPPVGEQLQLKTVFHVLANPLE